MPKLQALATAVGRNIVEPVAAAAAVAAG
jgi:hypothetical protein